MDYLLSFEAATAALCVAVLVLGWKYYCARDLVFTLSDRYARLVADFKRVQAERDRSRVLEFSAEARGYNKAREDVERQKVADRRARGPISRFSDHNDAWSPAGNQTSAVHSDSGPVSCGSSFDSGGSCGGF